MNTFKNIETTNFYDAYEHRCIEEIMDYFIDENKDPIEIEIWTARKLIELMNELKNDENLKDIITKAIIILNALSQNNPSDTFTSLWDNTKSLTQEEWCDFNISLKKELLIL